jgi:hypothetical protein
MRRYGIAAFALALAVSVNALDGQAAPALSGLSQPHDLSGPAHCRAYPHRHRGAKPHGFSRGCPKRERRPRRSKT